MFLDAMISCVNIEERGNGFLWRKLDTSEGTRFKTVDQDR